jgi:hypothetical protein
VRREAREAAAARAHWRAGAAQRGGRGRRAAKRERRRESESAWLRDAPLGAGGYALAAALSERFAE